VLATTAELGTGTEDNNPDVPKLSADSQE
jgi:hypothetical protein